MSAYVANRRLSNARATRKPHKRQARSLTIIGDECQSLLRFESKTGEPRAKRRPIDEIAANSDHLRDIGQMTIRSPLLEVAQLAENDILDGREAYSVAAYLFHVGSLKGPGVQCVFAGHVAVSSQAVLVVADVEVAVRFACTLRLEHFNRRHVDAWLGYAEAIVGASSGRRSRMRSMSRVKYGSP